MTPYLTTPADGSNRSPGRKSQIRRGTPGDAKQASEPRALSPGSNDHSPGRKPAFGKTVGPHPRL
jgi:hypothetical protein